MALGKDEAFGSKSWFSKSWDDISETDKQQMRDYDKTHADDEELEFSHKIYGNVKDGCNVGYLHRKNNRLKVKDELMETFTKVLESSVNYFIEHKNKFSGDGWLDLSNVRSMVANSNYHSLLQEKGEPYFNAMYAILNFILDPETIQKITSIENDEEKQKALLDEIMDSDTTYDVMVCITEIMSAHLSFNESFPSNWLEPAELGLLETPSTNPVLDGRIYNPSDNHCWIVNLSWMMSHLHKGNEFVIFSDVSPESLRRTTEGHVGELSGFAREITLAKKVGYQFQNRDGGGIRVYATDEVKQRCQDLSFENVKMTDEEIEKSYGEIVKEVKELEEKSQATDEAIKKENQEDTKFSNKRKREVDNKPNDNLLTISSGHVEKKIKEDKEQKTEVQKVEEHEIKEEKPEGSNIRRL